LILAGDVGATKILLEVGEFRDDRWISLLERRYGTADSAHFPMVVERFLDEWRAVRPPRSRITGAGFGVAGPAIGNRVKMTHRPLVVDGTVLSERFEIADVRVVNDLEAAARGIEGLGARDFVTLQPGKMAFDSPRVVLGVGTGLGVAYLVPEGDGWRTVGGEGGHVGFSPASAPQAKLWESLASTHGRVEAEQVASGMGLANIDAFLGGPGINSEEVLGLFAECLGNIAGDHALAVMARGGIYLTGGVIAKTIEILPRDRFRAAFCGKAAQSAMLMKIPVRAVINERIAVAGAARLVA
jgi:glucokinase